MELTKEEVERLANYVSTTDGDAQYMDELVVQIAKQLLAEMDAPKIWDNAPKDATFASVHYAIESGKPYPEYSEGRKAYFYYRVLPKSRIDEIAENCWHEINKGMTGLPVSVIKSAILRALEEKESNR